MTTMTIRRRDNESTDQLEARVLAACNGNAALAAEVFFDVIADEDDLRLTRMEMDALYAQASLGRFESASF